LLSNLIKYNKSHMLDKLKSLKDAALQRASKDESPEDTYVVALDVGTEFVKALIGRVVEDDVEIIGVGRKHQGLNDMQAGAVADIQAVTQNCDEALAQAEEEAGVSVRTAVIGIAGELVKGTTTTVRVSRKVADKPIDVTELERIIRLVQERAEQKARQELAWELGSKDVEVRLVNSALVGIEIDGYVVTNPVGFQGRDVVVQLYTAFAPMIHIAALERVAQQLDLDLLAVAAEPFAVSRSVLGNKNDGAMNAILMDVGGGTTDIAVITDGGVQGTEMFGIGGRAYTRGIERDLGVDFDTAEEYKLGLDGTTPKNKIKPVEKSLAKTVDVWVSGVSVALAEFDKLDHLPNRILLCGGGSSLDMLMDSLSTQTWYTDLPFTRKPVVQHIHPEDVVGIADMTGRVSDHTFITAMGLLRVGLDTLQYSGGEPTSLQEKIDRILRV